MVRALDQLDAVAGGVGEADEATHAALFAGVSAAVLHGEALVGQNGRRRIQRGAVAQLEAHRVVVRIAFEVHQRVVALVAAVPARAGFAARQFQAHHLAGEAVGCIQIARSESDVADVEQVDHAGSPKPARNITAVYSQPKCARTARAVWLIGATGACGNVSRLGERTPPPFCPSTAMARMRQPACLKAAT